MAKMNGRGMLITAAFVALAFLSPLQAKSSPRWFVDFESGSVFPGYNDVRIPGNSGTLFSLTDDLATRASLFLRVRAGHLVSSASHPDRSFRSLVSFRVGKPQLPARLQWRDLPDGHTSRFELQV